MRLDREVNANIRVMPVNVAAFTAIKNSNEKLRCVWMAHIHWTQIIIQRWDEFRYQQFIKIPIEHSKKIRFDSQSFELKWNKFEMAPENHKSPIQP